MKKIISILLVFVMTLPACAIDDLSKKGVEEKFVEKFGDCSKYKIISIGEYEYPNAKGKYIRTKQGTKYIINGYKNNMCQVNIVSHDKLSFMYKSKTCLFPDEYLAIFKDYLKQEGVQIGMRNLDDMYCKPANVEW